MTMDLEQELERLIAALDGEGIDYAICGGLAVAIHGYPRATRDINLMVRKEALERVMSAAAKAGFTLVSGIIPFDAGKKQERNIYRISKARGEDHLTLDLLLVPPFLEDVWNSREKYRVGKKDYWIVSREGLMKMKRLAGRPQDLADLDRLEKGQE